MLPRVCEKMCKCCQYCLESWYWKCCEERFCFDKKIAAYQFEDVDEDTWPHVYNNMGASMESVVTNQPGGSVNNNNHLPQISQLPVHADKIYEVFSKSMIFREDPELSKTESFEDLEEMTTKSEPDLDRPGRTVYFEDEVDNPITDFEIMFRDELLRKRMSKIDEEIGSDASKFKKSPSPQEDGLVMKIKSEKPPPDPHTNNITMKDQNKITTQKPIYEYDPYYMNTLPPNPHIPRNESVKSILRVNSSKELTRTDSSTKLKPIHKVDSLKNIEQRNINRVLSKIPNRSASFLNIPDHLLPEKPLQKSKSVLGLLDPQISKMPDTPIIKSSNLPKFFEQSPLPLKRESFKPEISLAALKESELAKMKKKDDLSMPRYYGTLRVPSPVPVHESKSMPDLRAEGNPVSKRLVKMRSKLKPLTIKKDLNEHY